MTVYLNWRSPPGNHKRICRSGNSRSVQGHSAGRTRRQFRELQGIWRRLRFYDRALMPARWKPLVPASGVHQVEKPYAAIGSLRLPSRLPRKLTRHFKTIHVPGGFLRCKNWSPRKPLVMDPVRGSIGGPTEKFMGGPWKWRTIHWGGTGKGVNLVDELRVPGRHRRRRDSTDKVGRCLPRGLSFSQRLSCLGPWHWSRPLRRSSIWEGHFGRNGKAGRFAALCSSGISHEEIRHFARQRVALGCRQTGLYCASGSHPAGYGKDSQIFRSWNRGKASIRSAVATFAFRPDIGRHRNPKADRLQYLAENRDGHGGTLVRALQKIASPLWHYVAGRITDSPCKPETLLHRIPKHRFVTPLQKPARLPSQAPIAKKAYFTNFQPVLVEIHLACFAHDLWETGLLLCSERGPKTKDTLSRANPSMF